MTGLNLLPIFLIGLVGSVHCVGMCGGIVGAFSLASAPPRRFPVPVIAANAKSAGIGAADAALRTVSYNVGRIGSYGAAGAIAGGVARGAQTLASASILQVGGYWLAYLMVVALGLAPVGSWR